MKVNMDFLPDASSGDWSIQSFNVPEKEISQIISLFKTGRSVPPGNYKKLVRSGTVVMSNTPDEIRDFMPFVRAAHGHILINGLGMGTVIVELLKKDSVTKITVIEQSSDVISLVSPYIKDDRLEIINECCFEYNPPKGTFYNAVWHDIWDYICSDNLKEMETLHRKYGKRCEWQDSWAKSLCQQQKKRDKRYSYFN